jgi:hypothetical protein
VIVSEARLAANRRNSKLSKGPKTPRGKEISRANALKHGLCASVIVVEDVFLVQDRAAEFFNTLKPQNEFHCWLVNEVALDSIKIDRCERIERRVRDKASLRAEFCWEDDRKLEAIALAERLPYEPEKVVEQLRGTPQGCEWLMARWAMLARVADLDLPWTADQAKLAFDLLGTPREFREGLTLGESLDFEGKVVAEAASPAVVARREIAALKERREQVEGLDEVNRHLARADLTEDDNAELKRVRRHESTIHGRLRWSLRELRYQSPDRSPHRGLYPRWIAQQVPRPDAAAGPKAPDEILAEDHPADAIHPPFDLELEELPAIGRKADYPAILRTRAEKKIAKAEARRDAQRRKVERLRA